ncbi:MAG: LysR family transcriptional regulator [Gammaproteobacteria bacterium]|nr:LysR family transcriptional regulator [Gammaproteobacteria bacterium]
MLKLKIIISYNETMWHKLNTFIVVAEQAGFAKAAKKLGFSKAMVTRYIKELEAEYQAKFFTRTTRHVSLTQQGEAFYQYVIEMLQLHDAASDRVSKAASSIQGNIKVGLPVSILHAFSKERVAQLVQAYPELSMELICGNHINDLISSHFDLVLHCGSLPDVNFYHEKIATWEKMLCASPHYLEQSPPLNEPADLAQHQCLDHADNHTLCWQLYVNGKLTNIAIDSKVKVNSSIVLKQLAIQGLGIVYLPSFTVQKAILAKQLVPLIPQSWPDKLTVYVLYPLRKRYNKKISIVVEALQQLLCAY